MSRVEPVSERLTWPCLDDFEVAIFLTETSSRHAILKKEKNAKSEKSRLGTTKGRLTASGTKDLPMELGDEEDPPIIREESLDEDNIAFADIPIAGDAPADGNSGGPQQEGGHTLFLSDESENETIGTRPQRAGAFKEESLDVGAAEDDKKKLGLNTMYDGFSIYGRILCLVVKRRGTARGKDMAGAAGQAMMEEWISSTQAVEGQIMDD